MAGYVAADDSGTVTAAQTACHIVLEADSPRVTDSVPLPVSPVL